MGRQISILVIEDEEAIHEGLIDVLVSHKYDVDSAAAGPEGLEKALTGKFDLILLDIMLPGMDGYEICDRIRAEDRDQPIIMLTAKTSDDEIIQGPNPAQTTMSPSHSPSSNSCCASKRSFDARKWASSRTELSSWAR